MTSFLYIACFFRNFILPSLFRLFILLDYFAYLFNFLTFWLFRLTFFGLRSTCTCLSCKRTNSKTATPLTHMHAQTYYIVSVHIKKQPQHTLTDVHDTGNKLYETSGHTWSHVHTHARETEAQKTRSHKRTHMSH